MCVCGQHRISACVHNISCKSVCVHTRCNDFSGRVRVEELLGDSSIMMFISNHFSERFPFLGPKKKSINNLFASWKMHSLHFCLNVCVFDKKNKAELDNIFLVYGRSWRPILEFYQIHI